ncbi:hypothetical protein E2562_028186 [Oryza meyeriana var. granulata]|uniref:DUF679 domain-containing protein n=1 Tax=Oryza meyeriana var. granulata TaxID=110450 RepID=A0A6G1CT37_9ORYZ|nr:hypothetical protein E2562_028186 [Oryza meyeriana var. granulata]
MASNKQIDLESQKPATSSPAAATAPPTSTLVEPPAVPVSVGITNGHDVPPETEPLLLPPAGDGDGGADDETTRLERAITRAFRSTAELAKHLPTGAVLVFEVLSPVFTNGGKCHDVNRVMTAWLVGLCAAACFFLCFTDSFHDRKGTVRYVVATHAGLWVIDGTAPPPPEVAATYCLRFIDFFHAVLSLVVFLSVAMFDRNVGACFYPVMSYDTRQVLTAVPLAGGLVGTMLFATFPSTRHGIGFPVHVA